MADSRRALLTFRRSGGLMPLLSFLLLFVCVRQGMVSIGAYRAPNGRSQEEQR